jgi:soluble lytic murein transglycosylase
MIGSHSVKCRISAAAALVCIALAGSGRGQALDPAPVKQGDPADTAMPTPDGETSEFLSDDAAIEVPDVLRGPAIPESDLAPYFATGKPKAALQLYQEGKFTQALAQLPPSPKDQPTRWMRALALRGDGQSAPAQKVFEALALEGGPLADRATHLAALCAIDSGDSQRGEQLLAQVSLRYVDADQALLERARLQAKLRPAGPATAAKVEEVLAPIFDARIRADVASAHLLAGEAEEAAGKKESARVHYQAAWVEHPLSGAAASAQTRERGLGPGGAQVSLERLIKRSEILLDAQRTKDALEGLSHLRLTSLCTLGCPGDKTAPGLLASAAKLLAPGALPEQHEPTPEDIARGVVAPADPLVCRARLDEGRAMRRLHDYAKARVSLAAVVLRCADPNVRAPALFLLAQLEGLAGKPDTEALWAALAEHFPTTTLADDALLNQAIVRRKAGDPAGARVLLQKLVDQFQGADTRPEAIFQIFWSLRSEGKAREGLGALDQLAARPDAEGAGEERARYWRARTLLEPAPGATDAARAAELQAAQTDLAWLVSERPLTYYGLLARSRLAELDAKASAQREAEDGRAVIASLAAARAQPLHAGSFALDPHLAAGIQLMRMGLGAEAQRELNAIDRQPARDAGPAGYEPLTLLADLLSRSGDLRGAHQIVRVELRDLLRRPHLPLSLRAAALAYPLAFRDSIVKSTAAANIPPDLLQALMREESALDPRAFSTTGAMGLTQLMPATARGVARKLKLKGFQLPQLYDPATNIQIGGSYLGELFARFNHPALAFAAYNAGPGAVGGWMKSRGAEPMDAFVEEIPLDETRGYVKRCLRSYAAYLYLYGAGPSRLPKVSQRLATR